MPVSKKAKKDIIHNLKHDVYCRLGVSKLPDAGVGVIAIRDIPKGVNPFRLPNDRENPAHSKSITLTEKDLKHIPGEVVDYFKDFSEPTDNDDGTPIYGLPIYGLNTLDISWYLNHQDHHNLDIQNSDSEFSCFLTNRPIRKGEELYINYQNF